MLSVSIGMDSPQRHPFHSPCTASVNINESPESPGSEEDSRGLLQLIRLMLIGWEMATSKAALNSVSTVRAASVNEPSGSQPRFCDSLFTRKISISVDVAFNFIRTTSSSSYAEGIEIRQISAMDRHHKCFWMQDSAAYELFTLLQILCVRTHVRLTADESFSRSGARKAHTSKRMWYEISPKEELFMQLCVAAHKAAPLASNQNASHLCGRVCSSHQGVSEFKNVISPAPCKDEVDDQGSLWVELLSRSKISGGRPSEEMNQLCSVHWCGRANCCLFECVQHSYNSFKDRPEHSVSGNPKRDMHLIKATGKGKGHSLQLCCVRLVYLQFPEDGQQRTPATDGPGRNRGESWAEMWILAGSCINERTGQRDVRDRDKLAAPGRSDLFLGVSGEKTVGGQQQIYSKCTRQCVTVHGGSLKIAFDFTVAWLHSVASCYTVPSYDISFEPKVFRSSPRCRGRESPTFKHAASVCNISLIEPSWTISMIYAIIEEQSTNVTPIVKCDLAETPLPIWAMLPHRDEGFSEDVYRIKTSQRKRTAFHDVAVQNVHTKEITKASHYITTSQKKNGPEEMNHFRHYRKNIIQKDMTGRKSLLEYWRKPDDISDEMIIKKNTAASQERNRNPFALGRITKCTEGDVSTRQ
ncbi:hypothetical protein F2P81_015646 [Scophthalmus maximus]|uniref:Uncharacterized protein n=1 Tax=Scophthalmus maximus TaxID=52904 RepID=A0A6A4SIY7_SCOMX|nr:hypothetical protein F2P81_015646 [Scophthalmus maximus]